MSLKVLLADDSAAIKKVIQLSLQDFGVELRAVGSGKDVLDVARHYVPDIAFIDVLLPHQTGYEVAAQMKKDATLKKTPIVMLWSAFMAFDEAKFKASGAEEKLEKPFEVNALRDLVSKLVPKKQGNPLSKHLDFPKAEFDGPIGAVPPAKKPVATAPTLPPLPPQATPQAAAPAPIKPIPATSVPPFTVQPSLKPKAPAEEWSMGSFDDIASFSANLEKDNHAKDGHPFDGEIDLAEDTVNLSASPRPTDESSKVETDFFNFGGTVNKTMTHPFNAKPTASTTQVAPQSADAGVWTGDNSEWVRKDLDKFKVSIPDEGAEDGGVPFQYNENEIKSSNFLLRPDEAVPLPVLPESHDAAILANDHTQVAINPSSPARTPLTGQGPAANSQPAANVNSQSVPRPGHSEASTRYEVSEKDIEKIREELKAEMRAVIERVVWKLVPEIASQIIRDEITRLTNE